MDNNNFNINIVLDKRFHNLIKNISNQKEIKKIFLKGLRNISLLLDRTTAINTPIDTGILRSKQRLNINNNSLKSTIKNNTFYSLFVHEGTKYQKSQPWMKESIDENRNILTPLFNKGVEQYFKNLTKNI